MLFLLHWRYELPCQDKLPEFHCTPILGCIRVLWLVFHPLGLRLDKTLCGWNSVSMKRSHEEADDDDDGSGSTKQRMIQYDCDHARRCIQQDYLGPSPIFNPHKFQWIFHITPVIYDCIKAEIKDHNFYNISDYDVTGHPTICIDAELLIALKHLGYGCATNAWIDYFQIGESTGCLCVDIFCKTIVQSTTLCEPYLWPY